MLPAMEENGGPPRNRYTDVRGMHASLEQLREQIVDLLPRLRRFARTLARDPHDADDLVQIAVERALARSEQLRPDSRLSSWMFGILRNAWIDETRTRGRRNQVFAPEALAKTSATPRAKPTRTYSLYRTRWPVCPMSKGWP